MSLLPVFQSELNEISTNIESFFLEKESIDLLKNKIHRKNLILSGGTGFFGKWLIQSYLNILDKFALEGTIWVITRDRTFFQNQLNSLDPFIKSGVIRFIEADLSKIDSKDILQRELPPRVDWVIHAATPASADENINFPLRMFDTITVSTRILLESLAERNVEQFLLTSSGAVYGELRENKKSFQETDFSGPSTLSLHSAYGEGKRVAELFCTLLGQQYEIPVRIARCFAFLGPYLPLQSHFAIGNFLQSAWNGKKIEVRGDGTPIRSYLYVSELIEWLWIFLFANEAPKVLNIGSEFEISISELAKKISKLYEVEFKIEKMSDAGVGGNRYIPNVSNAKRALGLTQRINLEESILRFEKWYRASEREISENT